MTDFRSLPSVDRLISDERVRAWESIYPHDLLVRIVRASLDHERAMISDGNEARELAGLIEDTVNALKDLQAPRVRRVINATGVILHTNLGRAPLSAEAVAAMENASKGFSNTELDILSGGRGSRQSLIEPLIRHVTGAEAALVVNNNAAAVLLGLAALAPRREVIVSRGEAVEIGDSFRIPDVMRQSGAKLVEVGTTNCTYARDYEEAITERTVALMRVHSSNFLVMGFTHSVTVQELNQLGERRGMPVLDDLGSGALLDTAPFGLKREPMAQESISAGTGLVFFSGDKLVGGPQAGIIAGKKVLIDRLKKHPLARAVRIDKVRLAGLAATLLHYLKGEAIEKVPVWRMIATRPADLDRRAHSWRDAAGNDSCVVDGESMVGGGSLPGGTLPTKLLAIRAKSEKRRQNAVQTLARKLREYDPPVIARISEDALLLDPRTVFPEEDEVVIEALRSTVPHTPVIKGTN